MTRSVVYFIKPIGRDGPIKIGVTTFIEKRIAGLTGGSPLPLEVLVTIPGNRITESLLHRFFMPEHSHGEWFLASDRLMHIIAELIRGAALNDLLRIECKKQPNTDPRQYVRFFSMRLERAFESVGLAIPPDVVEVMRQWNSRGSPVWPTADQRMRIDECINNPRRHGVQSDNQSTNINRPLNTFDSEQSHQSIQGGAS